MSLSQEIVIEIYASFVHLFSENLQGSDPIENKKEKSPVIKKDKLKVPGNK
jgi:hypothetical protein